MSQRTTIQPFLFKVIAILLPFSFLILIEVGLRIFGYGYNEDVFIQDENFEEFVYLNPNFSKKYFLVEKNATIGNREVFKKIKPEKTFRVFVLGASTAVGFPFYHNGSFHRMLQYKLQREFPEQHIEIINLSLTAVNSYALADMAKAVVDYSPDAVMIYAGHNEYYGAMGAASLGNLGGNPWLINTITYLRQFRIIQWFSRLKNNSNLPESADEDLKENLMKRMAEDQFVPFNSLKYQKGISQFEYNLDKILATLESHNIPVFLSTISSNLRDQPPLMNRMNEGKKAQLEKALEKIRMDSTYDESVCINIVEDSIDCTYCLGKLYDHKKNYEKAEEYYLKAKEMDALRFRAPEKINGIIKSKALAFAQVSLVETSGFFKENAFNGIVGNDLMMEHLHPNATGYALMATAFDKALKASELLISSGRIQEDFTDWQRDYPLLAVDSLYAEIGTLLLREGWPFYEKIEEEDKSDKSFEEKLAGGLAVKQVTWSEATKALYDHYMQKNELENALKVTSGLILELPYDLRLYKRAASLADQVNKYELSYFYYQQAYSLQPTPEWAQGAFIASLKMDEPEKAIPFIMAAMKNPEKKVVLMPLLEEVSQIVRLKALHQKDPENIELVNQIAVNYSNIGNFVAARKYLNLALDIDRNDEDTRAIMEKINQNS